MFFTTLEERVQVSSSLLCIGLDPHTGQLPEPTPQAAVAFSKNIIKNTSEYAAAFKPNSAFFEQFGADGLTALKEVIQAIPSDIPVILDCKRGDIDTTAQAYAAAAYEALGAHAVTLSPYMGWDSIKPFVTGKYADKGAFVLCKTSNPSSNSLQQEKIFGDLCLYEKVLNLCGEWNTAATATRDGGPVVGVVAGATDLEALGRIRSQDPSVWILCPGVGAQGGAADNVCPVGLRSDGSGLLIAVSRGISGAQDQAATARKLRDEINVLREAQRSRHCNSGSYSSGSCCGGGGRSEGAALKPYQQKFIDFALKQQVLQFGSFTLKSGRVSPYFFNAGLFCSGPSLVSLSTCYAQAIHASGLKFDVIFGPAYKGIPLGTALAMAWDLLYHESKDVSYNRKEAKDHGEGGLLVGAPVKGRRVLVVDDVITAGTAIREAVALLQAAGAHIVAVAVCLDRQERASEQSPKSAIQQVEEEFGFPVVSVVQLQHLIQYVKQQSSAGGDAGTGLLGDIEAYRARYGIDN